MNVLLVDDEPLALDLLEKRLLEAKEVNIIGKVTNPTKVKELISGYQVDVVFLDIDMPEINGLELADTIIAYDPTILIVFVTAYNEFAIKAFEIHALDYLLKPISQERIQVTIKRIIKQKQGMASSSTYKRQQKLEIKLTNTLAFSNHSGKMMTPSFRTNKAKELFLYLLHNKNKLIIKQGIIDLLWPNLEAKKANNQTYITIHYIRKVIEPYSGFLTINRDGEGYILITKNVVIDLEDWEMKVKALPELHPNAVKAYQVILEQYKGEYLGDYHYWWAEEAKCHYQNLWLTHTFKLANYFKGQKNWEEAKYWYKMICRVQPENEAAHFELMKVFSFLNDNDHVHLQYQQLKQIMKRELDVIPSENITNWYQKWARYH
ncbi:response regulator [Amphibacillus sediminis]|uniref:response regulator n=1 Tax=Amphibacillus sediminis TaxID=360185 RepID=UPI000835E995|nr:response regulator [Amphibacillus sediminis]